METVVNNGVEQSGAWNSAFWRDRPVLVTGATGLVGGWLVSRLLEMQADVVCLVRDHVPAARLLTDGLHSKVSVVAGDICDQTLLERTLGEYEIATVFHLAAQTIVPIANRNPVSTFESNVRGTWCLLEACRRTPTIGQIVLASSDKAYGDQPDLPYVEDAALLARYPYDTSKACADMIARSYAETFGLPVVVTRCGNVFGGGDLNWNRIVPGTIRSIERGEPPVIRSDGRFVRDYFYVEDAAAAYTGLAEHLAEHPELAGRAFNFSNEERVTVLDLVEAILREAESPLRPVVRNEANGEIREQFLSAARARQELGWRPLFTLQQGLRRTIPWYRAHLGAEA